MEIDKGVSDNAIMADRIKLSKSDKFIPLQRSGKASISSEQTVSMPERSKSVAGQKPEAKATQQAHTSGEAMREGSDPGSDTASEVTESSRCSSRASSVAPQILPAQPFIECFDDSDLHNGWEPTVELEKKPEEEISKEGDECGYEKPTIATLTTRFDAFLDVQIRSSEAAIERLLNHDCFLGVLVLRLTRTICNRDKVPTHVNMKNRFGQEANEWTRISLRYDVPPDFDKSAGVETPYEGRFVLREVAQ